MQNDIIRTQFLNKKEPNEAQNMWIDILHSCITQKTFDQNLGGLSYVFRNMIAKYVSSENHYYVTEGVAEIIDRNEELRQQIDQDLPINIKKYFYGRNHPTLLEHMVPATVVANQLVRMKRSDLSRETVCNILSNAGSVAIMLRQEDAKMNCHKLKLKSQMPPGWNYGDSVLARYEAAGIKLSQYIVRRGRTIFR